MSSSSTTDQIEDEHKILCPYGWALITPVIFNNNIISISVTNVNKGFLFFEKCSMKRMIINGSTFHVVIDKYEYENIDTIDKITSIATFNGGNITTYDYEKIAISSCIHHNVISKQDHQFIEQKNMLYELRDLIIKFSLTESQISKHGTPNTRNETHIQHNNNMQTMYMTTNNNSFIIQIITDLINAFESVDQFTPNPQFYEIDIRNKNGETFQWSKDIRGKIIYKYNNKYILQIPASLGFIYTIMDIKYDKNNFYQSTVLMFEPRKDDILIQAFSDFNIPFNVNKYFLHIIISLMCDPIFQAQKENERRGFIRDKLIKSFSISKSNNEYSVMINKLIEKAFSIFINPPGIITNMELSNLYIKNPVASRAIHVAGRRRPIPRHRRNKEHYIEPKK